MAIQEQRTLPAPFIEDIGKDFAKSLIGVTGLPALAADISGQLTKRTDPATGELETDEAFQRRQDIARERFQTFQQTQAGQAPFAPQVAGQDPLQTQAAVMNGWKVPTIHNSCTTTSYRRWSTSRFSGNRNSWCRSNVRIWCRNRHRNNSRFHVTISTTSY